MDNRAIRDRTNEFRRASKAFADRVDAVAQEVSRAKGKLGKRLAEVEAAVAEADESAREPNERVESAVDAFAAEAKRSFERIVTRKKPRRFLFW